MSNNEWLQEVLDEKGWKCGNCDCWRLLKDREIEECPDCHDDAFDVYDFVSEYEYSRMP